MTHTRPMPRHAAVYLDAQQRRLPYSPQSTLSRVLAWYRRTSPGRPAILRNAFFPFVVIALFVLFLREEFWLAVEQMDWRRVDRVLTFAGAWFLGMVLLYLVVEILLAAAAGAFHF